MLELRIDDVRGGNFTGLNGALMRGFSLLLVRVWVRGARIGFDCLRTYKGLGGDRDVRRVDCSS